MGLDEFLSGPFALYFHDDAPTLIISTTDRVSGFKGVIDKENPPKEEMMELSKKAFAQAFTAYAEAIGVKEMSKHPSRFVKDYGLDLYRGEVITPATQFIHQWRELSDAN